MNNTAKGTAIGGGGGAASEIGTGGPGGGGGGGGAAGNVAWVVYSGTLNGYYHAGAKGGTGGTNGNGSTASSGASVELTNPCYADYRGNLRSSASKYSDDAGWEKDNAWHDGGGGGGRGSSSDARPLRFVFEIQFNVMNEFGGTIEDRATAGYRSNTDLGEITVTIPTTHTLGLIKPGEYVASWSESNSGTGSLKAAYDEYRIGSGTNNLYGVWKEYSSLFSKGDGTKDNPFIIEQAGLLTLADYVNAGGNTKNLYFKQEGDIVVSDVLSNTSRGSEWKPIGHTRIFEGDYDGGGYLIRKAKIENTGTARGIFGKVLGTIHNFGAEDITISTDDENVRCGAVAGMLVRHDTELTQAGSIHDCYSALDSISAPYGGCLVGEMEEASSISHCHEISNALQGSHAASIASMIHSSAKVDWCFIGGSTPSANGYSNATNTTTGVSASKMASGEITWLLNGKSAFSGVVWYQDLADQPQPDAYPVLNKESHLVYGEDETYSNNALGLYTFPGSGTVEDPFLIGSAADLERLAKYCNDGNKSTGLYFLQTADIDLNGGGLTPIANDAGMSQYDSSVWSNHTDNDPRGDDAPVFDGYYDGGGHTISNGNISSDYILGIFGTVTGTVTRLCVENTSFNAKQNHARIGAIAGYLRGDGTITNCFVKGCTMKYNGSLGIAGGIVADMYNHAVVSNCLSYQNTLEASRTGYITSDMVNGTTLNWCYTDGDVLKSNNQVGGNVTNSYPSETATSLGSGSVAFGLNNRKNDNPNPAWFQTIGEDKTPVLDSNHSMVFYLDYVYTNDYYDISRLGDGTASNPYKISNAEELQQIIVSIGVMKRSDFHILQTADIDLKDTTNIAPIGTGTKGFEGHYDGGGHVIRNLTMPNYDGESLGLFNNISGTVERLSIEHSKFLANATVEVVGKVAARVGAFAGRLTGNGVLRNCYVTGSTIDFCSTPGTVVGALVGEQTDASRIESCYGYQNIVRGQDDGNRHYGYITGYIGADASADRVFTDGEYLCGERQKGAANMSNAEAGVTELRFRSGEICYLLSGEKSETSVAWRQTIKTDDVPVLDGKHGLVYRHALNQQTLFTNSDDVPYAVTIYLNENYDEGATKTVQAFKADNSFFVPDFMLEPYAAERQYFYFVGWNSQKDGKGTFYPRDGSLQPQTNNPELYAMWDMKVPADGETSIVTLPEDTIFFRVYDNGGYNRPYGKNYDGKLMLIAPDDCIISLTGTVSTESADDDSEPGDYLTVYDGDVESTTKLTNAQAKSGDVYFSTSDGVTEDIGRLMSSENIMTIQFNTNATNHYYGLDLLVTVLPKDIRSLGIGTAENPVKVATADDLLTLHQYVVVTGDSKIHVQQTADIDMTGKKFTPIDDTVDGFEGVYDGCGYTISNLTLDGDNASSAGLFRNVSGTVQRLGIVNSTFKGIAGSVGAFAGRLSGKGQLRYCYALDNSIAASGAVGILVGQQTDASLIESCYGYHNVVGGTAAGQQDAAPVVGQISNSASQNLVFTDASSSSFTFLSGEICHQLNSAIDSIVWRQTLGADSVPLLSNGSDVVYRHEYNGGYVYSNYATAETVKFHLVNVFDSSDNRDLDVLKGTIPSLADLNMTRRRFVLTGWNTEANGSGTAYPFDGGVLVDEETTLYSQWRIKAAGTDDDPYTVTTSGDLKDLSEYIDLTGKADFHVLQEADLDMTDVAMKPIGSKVYPFRGVYDGDGHVIRNVKMQSTSGNLTTGVFGMVTGTVTRLGVENATIEGVNDNACIGAIAGRLNGSGAITYCYVRDSRITSDKASVAGVIVGDMFEKSTIKNCFTYNNTLKATRTAHICSDTKTGTVISHCYTDGNSLFSEAGASVTDSKPNMNAKAFNSGEVCYLLNGSQSNDVVWRQTLGTDNLPVIGDDHGTVYRYEKSDLSQTKYSNSSVAPEEVTITLDYNDGSGNTKTFTAFRQQYEFENETEIASFNDITFKDAYSSRLIGWAETADGVATCPVIRPYRDMTLYAQWDSLAFCIPARAEREIQIPQSVNTIKVYDQEGPNGPYYEEFNGTLKLTVPEKKVMLVSGTVCTESQGWRGQPTDYLTISADTGKLTNEYASKDEEEERNGLYYSESSGTPKSIGRLVTSANKVYLKFISDDSKNYDGLDLDIKVTEPIFYINNREDFMAYADIKGDVYLNQDIDLGEWNESQLDVTGNFDGNGHTIIYTGSDNCTGLFRNVKSGASVKHLRVSANVVTTKSESAGIALSNEGTISDCHFRGKIRYDGWRSCHLAGIALKGNGTIDHCSATGEITGQSNIYQISKENHTENCTWVEPNNRSQSLTDIALQAQADYPVYAQGILDVTKPEIVVGDQTIQVGGDYVHQLIIVDGQRFSCPSDMLVREITYKRRGTNGAYEPWVLPFDYTVDAYMFKSGVEFYRFEKSPMGDIQTVQIKNTETYQVAANEPLAFRTTGEEEYAFNIKYVKDGNRQDLTIRIPADGTAATLASGNHIARIKVTYEGIPADRTASEMMYIWDDSKGDFVLPASDQALADFEPFRYYLQYIDKTTGNYEKYEDTDWARMEANSASAQALANRHAAQRAPLSQLTTEGWQPIILDPRGSQEVTAKMLEDYEILGLWDLYDQASAPGTDDNTYAVSVIYVPVEEGMTLPYAVPLLVRAKHDGAEPLVTEEMGREIDALLTEAEAEMSEEEIEEAFDEVHYWCSTFGGRYDVWQFAMPEKDSLLNEYGALAFTAGADGPQFTRVPAADASTMQPMSYCFTAYDARTFETLPLASDRIEIVVLDPSVLTGIKTLDTNLRPYGHGDAYNLSGQKVDDHYRGIVIKNGRKVFRK